MSGAIWGKPTEPGEYEFTIEVEDKNKDTARRTFQIRVYGPDESEEPGESRIPDISWLQGDIPKEGELRITTDDLPDARVNVEYMAMVEAIGGEPRLKKKKPGSGRYWEFSIDTLRKAVARDDAYFGVSGTAIPSRKKHQTDPYRTIRIITWWPHEEVGKSEDASKHLQKLADDGFVQRVERIAKPEPLLKRLVQLFARDKENRVLSIGDNTASMAATATKMGRNFLHLTGRSEKDRALWLECAKPRLEAVFSGQDEYGITQDDDVEWTPSGEGVDLLQVGPTLIQANPSKDEYGIDLTSYSIDDGFVEAVCSIAGFRAVHDEEVDGISPDGRACKVLLGQPLTQMNLGVIASDLAPKYPSVTVLYESSDLHEDDFDASGISLLRIPFDLVG